MTPQAIGIAYSLLASTYAYYPHYFLDKVNVSKPGFTLVVGSNRQKKSTETNFARSLWSDDNIDFSYTDNLNVITLGIKPSAVSDAWIHICDDATTTTKVSSKMNIREIYLKLPWTFNPDDNAKTDNIVKRSIQNLLPGLRKGGKVTVEWQPFCVMKLYVTFPLYGYNGGETDRQKNPFTGFFDLNIARLATFFAIKKSFSTDGYAPVFIEKAQKLSPIVDRVLNFYTEKQSVTRVDLDKKLLLEVEILDQMMKEGTAVVYLSKDPNGSITEFNTAVDHMVIPLQRVNSTQHVKVIPLFVEKPKKKLCETRYASFSLTAFLASTLFYFLWSDISVITNAPLAVKCLKDLELTHVQLKRGTSPVNGRKNAWLLSGFTQ